MGDQRQKTEWLANAEVCRKMAERSNDPVLRARWLTLAQQWIELCESGPEAKRNSEHAGAAVQPKADHCQDSTSAS